MVDRVGLQHNRVVPTCAPPGAAEVGIHPGLDASQDAGADEGRPVYVTSADVSFSNGLWGFRDRHPDRFVQMGIAEQNMVSVSAGMASVGLEVYTATFASFLALLCCEQIRTDIACTQLPVRLIGHHSGISMGFYGTSHHATEDIAIMRSIANLKVIAPADGAQLKAAIRAHVDDPSPIYFRIGRGREPDVYEDGCEFVPGRAIVHATGEDLTLIATGSTVHPTLAAAEELRRDGLDIGVIDMHTIKPLDIAVIHDVMSDSGRLMTVEEHSIVGGLGGAVAEVLAETGSAPPLHRHGIRDEYSLIGPPLSLYTHYRLDGPGIASEARDFLAGGHRRQGER
jgi:transketolase